MKNSQQIISTPTEIDEFDGAADLSPDLESRSCTVGAQLHGKRLDLALVNVALEFSRSYLQQLIDSGDVQVNGEVVRKASSKVRAGDVLVLGLRPTPQSQAFKAEQIALDVVYEDADVWVINKAAGMVVHPAPGNWSGTLMNALLGRDARAFDMPRAGIVHRLDKDTSGLMVVARTRMAMDALVAAIGARSVKRQYLALAHGRWQGALSLCIDKPIGRDPANRLRMAVVDLGKHAGKVARTDVQCLHDGPESSLVRCTLHTGRTHQIRVHMACIGHPLVADVVYGGRLAAGLTRQGLHARHLAFDHPRTGQRLSFLAPVPVDLQSAMTHWGLKYNVSAF